MGAAVLDGLGRPLRIMLLPVAVPVPVPGPGPVPMPGPGPGPGEMLIQVEASGVCHTVVQVWRGDSVAADPPDPFIRGR
jgi:D-arabinose 1-dehydrogenase-like Zn-dependent alcohol dehydrogenase